MLEDRIKYSAALLIVRRMEFVFFLSLRQGMAFAVASGRRSTGMNVSKVDDVLLTFCVVK